MQMKRGFTLMELMVAIACASALAFAAWNCFDAYRQTALFFTKDYHRMSGELLQQLRNAVQKKTRESRGPSSNRF